MSAAPSVGDWVRFAPNPRWPDRKVEAEVIGRRCDPRIAGWRNSSQGWIETRDASGFERSVRPTRCEIVER